MYAPAVRIALVLAGLLLGARLLAAGNPSGWLPVAAGALLAWGHARYAGVWLAFRAYLRGDLRAMRRSLAGTRPHALHRQHRAFYDWMSGVLLMEEGRRPEARDALLAAAAGDLRTEVNRGIVYAQLASLSLEMQDAEGARRFLDEARSRPRRAALEPVLADLESRIPAEPS